MTDPRIRRAAAIDAPAISELFLASRRAGLPYLPEIHPDDETHQFIAGHVLVQCAVWVVEEDGRLLGFIAVEDDFVDHLYVAPEAQGRGIGSQLIALAMRERPAGLRLYCFVQNERARRFYEQRGFLAIAFGDGSGNEEGLPDVLYAWRPDAGESGT